MGRSQHGAMEDARFLPRIQSELLAVSRFSLQTFGQLILHTADCWSDDIDA